MRLVKVQGFTKQPLNDYTPNIQLVHHATNQSTNMMYHLDDDIV